MKILVVEDQEKLAKSLKKGLEQEGYAVDYVLDGEAAERRIDIGHKEYDLIVLDLMLPKKDGYEVCRNMRAHDIKTPVIVLTARGATEDKISALNIGADGYLVKPFSFRELIARINALLRRPEAFTPSELQTRDLLLNTATREVTRSGKVISLTLKEFGILEEVMANLVKNAIQYTPAGGEVNLNIEIKSKHKKANVIVRDTGVGIVQEDLPYIFEPFYRSDKSIHMHKQGNGLGLPLVREIVKRHRGFIDIQSVRGKGTSVTVSIPLAPKGLG
jgi:DNA-binding response OmpR family regulator